RIGNRASGGIDVKVLMVLILSLFSKKVEEKKNPLWLQRSLIQMEKDSNFLRGLNYFIQISGKSQEHLTRTMKSVSGKTPTEYLNDLKLTYAASELLSLDLSITEIAYASGFNNISHFNLLFKKKFGQPPGLYRKKSSGIFVLP
ncbi:MAG: hypothetical protein B6241_12715, partial [Spirochaetaceae bacterium 4572_59]